MQPALSEFTPKGIGTMRDFLNIGSSPPEESCAQLSRDHYDEYVGKAKIECRAYIGALRKKLGNEPDGAALCIKSFPHDFGTYYEVVCYFDSKLEESVLYAFKCESEGPETWDEVGMTSPFAQTA